MGLIRGKKLDQGFVLASLATNNRESRRANFRSALIGHRVKCLESLALTNTEKKGNEEDMKRGSKKKTEKRPESEHTYRMGRKMISEEE